MHLLHLSLISYKASGWTVSRRQAFPVAESSARLMPHKDQGPPWRWLKACLDLSTYVHFLKAKLNPCSRSACVQKRSLSSLILQGISYREQTQTTHTTFSVFFLSFRLSEMPGAWLVLSQTCGAALHGWRTCPRPRGFVGVYFLRGRYIQQSTEDCNYLHVSSLSSEGHSFLIKYQYLWSQAGRK